MMHLCITQCTYWTPQLFYFLYTLMILLTALTTFYFIYLLMIPLFSLRVRRIRPFLNLSNWFNENFLSLNPNKSNYIIFTGPRNKLPEDPNKSIILNNIAIKRVSNVKFLGVIIHVDEHLTWKSHINLVKNKTAKVIGIIKRLKFTLPLSALRILYDAFVLPCLNYGIIVRGGYKTPLQPIHLFQKKAVSRCPLLGHDP